MVNATTGQYPERESKTLEFKSSPPDFGKLVKTCVAFANGCGGEIVIGVEDGTRRVVGITDSTRDRIYDDFPNCVYDSVSPTLIPQILERNVGGVEVLVIKVFPGTRKPYFVKTEGSPRGVYTRVGSSTRSATPDVIEDLVREQRRTSFDEESSGRDRSVLSQDLLRLAYRGPITDNRLLADRVLVVSQGNQLHASMGGVLMFCDKPHEFVPEAVVRCTRFAGSEGRTIAETSELAGPIPQLVESAYALTLSYLERDHALSGTRLQGRCLVPPEAVREAIVNALIHRRYTVAGPVKIARFDDRLEIFSPGAFPGLVSILSLGDGTTVLRNLVVARIARKMKLMEKLGTGIRVMLDSCNSAGLPPPVFSEDGDFVKITFGFRKREEPALDKERIAAIAREQGSIQPRNLLGVQGVSRRNLTRMLSALVSEGVLVRRGTGPGVRYVPAEKAG